MQQLLSHSWPSCMPVWDKNAIIGNRNCKKNRLTHNRATSTRSTHTEMVLYGHALYIYKLCANALDVYSQKYYLQSPVFTARQIHCQLSLHRATVTPDGFRLNLRTRVPGEKNPGAPCPCGSPNSHHLSEQPIKKQNCREIKLAVRRHWM